MALTRIPGITYASAPRAEAVAQTLAWPPRLVVIHDTGNPTSNKEGEASYAHTRTDSQDRWTSAHAYIDQGGVLGSLRLDRRAWAAYSYANQYGIHLELCLPGNRTTTRRLAAVLTQQLCDLAGIPKVKLTPSQVAAGARGVCGHRDITLGLGVGNHTDPGADFPWSEFMSIVNSTGGSIVAESPLVENAERGVTALVSGTPKIKFDHDWPGSGMPSTGFDNPLVKLQNDVTDLKTAVAALPAGATLDYDQLADALLRAVGRLVQQ